MKPRERFEQDGKTFEAVEAVPIRRRACEGCCFDGNSAGCRKAPKCYGLPDDIHFVEVKE